MYVKKIELRNYRNYETLELALGRQTTVFIGKNGMGKSNLIAALKQSLSFMFTKSRRIGEEQSNWVANTMQKVKSFKLTDAIRKYKDGRQQSVGTYPVSITTQLSLRESSGLELDIEMIKESLSSGMKEGFINEAVSFWEHYHDLVALPVWAFYSDSFPHEKGTIGSNIQKLLSSEFGISQAQGYYNWDDPRDCSLVWQQYFMMQWKNLKFGHSSNDEAQYVTAVNECLKKFTKSPFPIENENYAIENKDFALNEITVVSRGKDDMVVLRFDNGMESDFESLPAGFRRVLSIAFDVANRAFLLNKNCDPTGVCFIDEIELHLHPSLAQEVLARLRYTFPRIQFIVSTHSPLVLSNFKQDEENVVYQLERNESQMAVCQKLPNSYGIDYNSLLENQMESPVRNSMLSELVRAYRYWREAGNEECMNRVLEVIVEKVGENSQLAKNL